MILDTDLLNPEAGRDEAMDRLKAAMKKYLQPRSSTPTVKEFCLYLGAYLRRKAEQRKLVSFETLNIPKEQDKGFVEGLLSVVIEMEDWARPDEGG